MPAPTLTAPSVQAVEHDWPCMKCGYNLRTIATNGLCPECAASVRESLLARPLFKADRRWVKRNAFGFLYVAVVMVPSIVGLQWLASRVNLPYRWTPLVEFLTILLGLLPAALLLLQPEATIDRKIWPGRWMLIIVVAHLICEIAAALQQFLPSTYRFVPLQSSFPFFFAAEIAALLWTAEYLCHRIPTSPMAVEIRWMRRAIVASLIAMGMVDLLVWFVAVVRFPSPVGTYVLGDFWGPIANVVAFIARGSLQILLCYLPFHLFRIYLHLRRSWIDTPTMNGGMVRPSET